MTLDERTLRLIAIGASITANCQPCLEHNIRKALENGADERQVAQAIEVGQMVRKGAAARTDQFAAELSPVAAAAGARREACGC